MSRVHYTNETIRKAIYLLDELEQSIGGNMCAAYPPPPNAYPEGKVFHPEAVIALVNDYHQEAITALVQILEHFPKLRRLLDDVEAEVLKYFVEAQEVEKKQRASAASLSPWWEDHPSEAVQNGDGAPF